MSHPVPLVANRPSLLFVATAALRKGLVDLGLPSKVEEIISSEVRSRLNEEFQRRVDEESNRKASEKLNELKRVEWPNFTPQTYSRK